MTGLMRVDRLAILIDINSFLIEARANDQSGFFKAVGGQVRHEPEGDHGLQQKREKNQQVQRFFHDTINARAYGLCQDHLDKPLCCLQGSEGHAVMRRWAVLLQGAQMIWRAVSGI